MKRKILQAMFAVLVCASARAQINTGSNGSDGAFNPPTNTVINMADHPDGIYQYSSVNIPAGVKVSFTPNVNNSPVVWLAQNDCVIDGIIDVSGQSGSGAVAGIGGPGGYAGGPAGKNGQGPGGGVPQLNGGYFVGNGGSFATSGSRPLGGSGVLYGNSQIIPLIGGSGGSGGTTYVGGGGGGAILIAATTNLVVNGAIISQGGNPTWLGGDQVSGGGGSGGAVRLVAARVAGSGSISVSGGGGGAGGGSGWMRFDTYQNSYVGSLNGSFSQGFQSVIIPGRGQSAQLSIATVGGVSVAATPGGALANPDVMVPANQTIPIPVVVNCSNVPLNSAITLSVYPSSGSPVTAVGTNNVGTQSASTATIMVNMPRGGGLISASAN